MPRSDSRAVLAGIGLFQGLVIWLMTDVWEERPLELRSAALGFVIAAGLTAQFTWTGERRASWGGVSLAFGAVIGSLTWWVYAQQAGEEFGDSARAVSWGLAAFVALYVAVPFAEIWQRTAEFRFPYPELFKRSWNSFFVGLVAAVFTSVTALLFVLWGELFSLVEIDFFEELFESAWFVSIVYAGVFGFGLAVGLESERITDALRRILFALCQVLLPVVSFAALMFLVVLPWTGLDPLWETGHASPVLLGIVALAVLFANAVYQDGSVDPPYATGLDLAVRVALAATPVYTILAAYSTWLRVAQYGLTPERVWALVIVFVASCYAIGYAGAIMLRLGGWLVTARQVNVAMSPVLVALALTLHSPLLDPLRLSAENQEGRLRRGDVSAEEFDYGLLRFRLGHQGEAALTRLEEDSGRADAVVVRERIAGVRAAESLWAWGRPGASSASFFVTLPPFVVPDGLWNVRGRLGNCAEPGSCLAFEANLASDAERVVCFGPALGEVRYLWCFAERDDAWDSIGSLQMSGDPAPTRDVLLERLRSGAGRAIDPRYRDLAVGEFVYRFNAQ